MNCILIDDETDCLELLAEMLGKHCPEIELLGQYNTPQEGIKAIRTLRPDLVFLDVEMPEINGFGVLEACKNLPFQVVFTTAFNEYAVKAFKYSAIGYLLKPIDREDLLDAVNRVQLMQPATHHEQQRELLFDLLQSIKPKQEKIALPTARSIVFLKISEIVYCEADSNCTKIYLRNHEKETVVTRRLTDLEKILSDASFYRLHNSYMINLKLVEKYIKGDDPKVMMSNGKNVPVSRHKKDALLSLLSKM